jgi:hypothetical protein
MREVQEQDTTGTIIIFGRKDFDLTEDATEQGLLSKGDRIMTTTAQNALRKR